MKKLQRIDEKTNDPIFIRCSTLATSLNDFCALNQTRSPKL